MISKCSSSIISHWDSSSFLIISYLDVVLSAAISCWMFINVWVSDAFCSIVLTVFVAWIVFGPLQWIWRYVVAGDMHLLRNAYIQHFGMVSLNVSPHFVYFILLLNNMFYFLSWGFLTKVYYLDYLALSTNSFSFSCFSIAAQLARGWSVFFFPLKLS